MFLLATATGFCLGLLILATWLCIGEINNPAELEFAPEWERRPSELLWQGPFPRKGA